MPLRVRMTIPLLAMEPAVEGLAAINCYILRALQGSAPRISDYDTQVVRYRNPGEERWRTIADILDTGEADCKSLVAAVCAEYRVYDGEPAVPVVYLTGREGRYHAVVRRADGTIEDPSRIILAAERGATR